MRSVPHDDGSRLLTSPDVEDVLWAAIHHSGGALVSWQLDHVDAHPRRHTTATYSATVDWPFGRRIELLGVSSRTSGPSPSDEQAVLFADGNRQVAVWLYPYDPDLPGLVRVAFPDACAALLTETGAVGRPVTPDQVRLEMIAYRPRRRAVVRVQVAGPAGAPGEALYVKVLPEPSFVPIYRRHRMLSDAGLPAPTIAATTPDRLLLLRSLPGRPLADALFDPVQPCRPDDLVGLLDAIPAGVTGLERHRPWADAVEQYATTVSAALPQAEPLLTGMVQQIRGGLADVPYGNEPTHGDFYEAQVFADRGRITGILDIDTLGPGRRADDLACLVAHLSTVQRMNTHQAGQLRHLIGQWMPVFDARVDPVELRLRAAAVAISLATGPYRGQEPNWQDETWYILHAADRLVRSAG